MGIKTLIARHYEIVILLSIFGILVGLISSYALASSTSTSIVTHCPRPAMWPSPDSCVSGERNSIESISFALPAWLTYFALFTIFAIMPFCIIVLGICWHEYRINHHRNLIAQ